MISLLDTLRRIDGGALTPAQALAAAREAIAARDGEVKAFVHLAPEAAGRATGPLAGIAVGVKDIIDTADMPTQMGSPIYAGWRPKADAPVVAALRAAGATAIGKTSTTAFAFLDPTATENPRAPGHTPGGSSSGSAAAVAGGLVPLALGTQTGGSVIRPASYCGIAGMKPSYRLLPTVGVKTFSWALDTIGLFAARVPDLACGLSAISGRPDLRLDPGANAGAPRLAIVTQDFAGEPEPESPAALQEAIRLAERAGARVTEATLDPLLTEAFAAHGTIQDYEARQALAWEYGSHRDALGSHLRSLLDEAQALTPEAYDRARGIAHRARALLDALFADTDAFLTFAAPGAPPKGLASTGTSVFNRLWTLMGVPCVSVPGLQTAAGLPVGIQVVAPFGRDREALAVAAFLEEAFRARA